MQTYLNMIARAFFILSFATLGSLKIASAQGVEEILRVVDEMRAPTVSVILETEVTGGDYRSNFEVDLNSNGEARAKATAGTGAGEEYLFTVAGLWFLSASSRRPIRIPPIQRIRGESVVGDLTLARFAKLYDIEDFQDVNSSRGSAIEIRLRAKSSAESFNRVVLLVDKSPVEPISAQYFLSSGKLARTATFSRPRTFTISGVSQKILHRTQFFSEIGPDSQTTVEIKSINIAEFDRSHFSRSMLGR